MRIALSVSKDEKAKGVQSPYFRALTQAGAAPHDIELLEPGDRQRLRAADFDGILFAGGRDVEPRRYGESTKYNNVKVDAERDQFELALLRQAQERRLPILGICRGIQLINVRYGGTLYQDLASEWDSKIQHRQSGSRAEATHSVVLTDPESHLAEVFRGSCPVNSLHHQAVKRLGRGLKVTARAEDGLIEAVEAADDYPFLMAVQWHPEEMVELPEQRKLFEIFLNRCRGIPERGR